MLQGKEFVENKKNFLEKLGIGLSLLCAIHCMLTPILVAFLPVVSSNIFHNPAIESILLGSSFLIVGFTNVRNFKKYHQKYQPIAIMVFAMSIILIGHFIHSEIAETICSIIGGCLLAYSVYVDQQAKKVCSK